MRPPTALPTFRRVPVGLGAPQLALAELPDATRTPHTPSRLRRGRRNDYPDLGLPGPWIAAIFVVLCSVHLPPGYFMLRRLLGSLFPHLFGPPLEAFRGGRRSQAGIMERRTIWEARWPKTLPA